MNLRVPGTAWFILLDTAPRKVGLFAVYSDTPLMATPQTADEAGPVYLTSFVDDVLHLTRDDGAGYQIRRVGPALIEASWVSSSGVATTPTTAGPEDFLRQRPDVLVSADCAGAIRSLAYGG